MRTVELNEKQLEAFLVPALEKAFNAEVKALRFHLRSEAVFVPTRFSAIVALEEPCPF